MNAAVAFHLAHQALSGPGGKPPKRPSRRGRPRSRLPRVLLLAVAPIAIVLAVLGGDAVGKPAEPGATVQPGAKKGGRDKAGPSKARRSGRRSEKGKARKGANKKGRRRKARERRRRGRRSRDDRAFVFYTARLEGEIEAEVQHSDVRRHSVRESASLRASRLSVQLAREQLTDPTTKETTHYYDLQLGGEGELVGGSSTSSQGAYTTDDGTSCSAETWTGTELGPSPFELQIGAALGLPGNNASIYAKRVGGSGTITYSGSSCTTANGITHTIDPHTFDAGVVDPGGGGLRVCHGGPHEGWTVTSTARGDVAWGRPFTVAVICTTDSSTPESHRFAGIRLTITMTPCPGRATSPC